MHTTYESSDLTEFRLEWLDLLRGQRRLSPKTLEAYERDLRQFCLYLTNISGSPASKSDFADLRTLTLRGFMAHRKEQGIDASSLSRGLSGVRSFVRFLEKRGEASSAAINLIRAPKTSANLPRPLSVDEALKLTNKDSYDDTEKWIILRDSALMSLLYGCGLRIGEALSLKVQDFPTLLGDHKDARYIENFRQGQQDQISTDSPDRHRIARRIFRFLSVCFKADRLPLPRCPRRSITALDSPATNASDASNIRLTQERHSPRHATFIRHPFIILGWQSKNDSRIIGTFQFKHDSEIHEG